MDLVMFTKYLKRKGGLSLGAAADRLADWGFDGADLTVREGGYVDPADAPDRLPAAVETFESRGLSVPMITTGITAADGAAAGIFEAADACGVGHLKLGYWRYDGFGTLRAGLDAMRDDLDGIAALAADHDVTPAVHIHSGDFLSAEAAVLADVLDDYDEIGAYVDPGHMAVEGGLGGWKQGLDRLAGTIEMVAVKDFGWFREDGWTRRTVPLDEGLVDWPAAFDYLDRAGFDGPVSIHAEYDHLDFDDLVAQAREDREHVAGILGR